MEIVVRKGFYDFWLGQSEKVHWERGWIFAFRRVSRLTWLIHVA